APPGFPPPPPIPPSPTRVRPTVPRKKLRPFFWNKLQTPVVASTVWGEVPTTRESAFDLADLEATFSLENASSARTDGGGKEAALLRSPSLKAGPTTLLDITRANNVAIMLSRIKLSAPDIRRALLSLDDERLTTDDLKAIGRQLPTTEEVARLSDFGDVSRLAKADQFFFEIMTIPHLGTRLECMIFRRRLELDVEELRPELDILRNASREVKGPPGPASAFQAVLSVGNALNGSTFRGGARGFKLDALLKLRETKTVKGGAGCPTLLHYIARILLRSDPTLVTFVEDMPHLEAAARVSVQTLQTSIASLVDGLIQVKEEMKRMRSDRTTPSGDQFAQVMGPFIALSTETIDAMSNMGGAVDMELQGLLAYFGETPDAQDAPKPEDFFSLILAFSASLQKAALEVHDADAKGAAKAKLAAAPAQEAPEQQVAANNTVKMAKDSLALPASQGHAASGHSIGRGQLDQTIRSMRDGRRRARPEREERRPLSKMFLDGGRPVSRAFD
ncbi:hypothetical protein K488DRAFT_83894, partial [Vararia minispora EC-137]